MSGNSRLINAIGLSQYGFWCFDVDILPHGPRSYIHAFQGFWTEAPVRMLLYWTPFAISNSKQRFRLVPESFALTNLARLAADQTNSQPQLAFALRRRPGKHNFEVANKKIKPENNGSKVHRTVMSEEARVKSFNSSLRVITVQNHLDAIKINISSTVTFA